MGPHKWISLRASHQLNPALVTSSLWAPLHVLALETAQLLTVNARLVAAPCMKHFLSLSAENEARNVASIFFQVFDVAQL